MKTRRKNEVRPQLEAVEDRCLLSLAVLEIQNNSTYNITFDFRWSSSSAWSQYTEGPGQGRNFWTGYSNSLSPQVIYDTSSYSGSQTTVFLAQGYNAWSGNGTPPSSAASQYEFLNTWTGVELYYAGGATTPTPNPSPPSSDAVLEVQNNTSYNISFDFRWNASSSWTLYTEGPGQDEIFWTSYSSSLAPQALYDATTSAGSQLTVSLAQGYGEWTGNGTPPASAATQYEFLNTTTGVKLYYGGSAPNPNPNPSPNPSPSPTPNPNPSPNPNAQDSTNWSGYVAATNFSNPKANSVTEVSGTWNVPTVTGPSGGTTYSSVWVGIDGYGGSTVEQVGTEEDMINGSPVYDAWWEMYSSGKGQPEQVITGMTIDPGDSITATVQYITSGTHAGQYFLSIVNNSRANDSFSTYQSSTQLQSPQPVRNCAEWIVEAPTVGGSIATVANFGSVTFTNATAVINGVSGGINSTSWSSLALNIASGGTTYDKTSVLSSSGESFTVSYNSAIGAQERSGTTVVAKTRGKLSGAKIQPGGLRNRKAGVEQIGALVSDDHSTPYFRSFWRSVERWMPSIEAALARLPRH